MKNVSRLTILILFVLVCGGGYNMAIDEKDANVFLMSKGNETHIKVKALKVFFVKIESNISTGYSWSIKKSEDMEKGLIKFKGKKEESEETETPKMGAPGYEILIFEAQGSGETVIELEYRRPWEKDTPPEKIHKVFVTIE